MSDAAVSLREIIDQRAQQTPQATYMIDPQSGTKTSYKALRESARSLEYELLQRGLKPGDTVAFALTNDPQAALVILGLFYGGFVATAVNLVSGQNTIAYVLDHSSAALVICQPHTEDLIKPCLKEGQSTLIVDQKLFANTPTGTSSAMKISSNDDGLLMYTSGTTGVPKGVVLTHRNLIAGGENTMEAHQLKPSDCGLCVLPLYHINGLCVTVLGALVSGSALIMPPKFSVSTFWKQLRDHAATWFSVVPTQISYLLMEADKHGHDHSGLENLRFGRSASAPLSPDVQLAFETSFNVPIIETMGLTETAAQILSNPIDGVRKSGSPGIPFGNEVMIADDNQKRCQTGQEGELLVRGPNVMKCYRNNPDATSESLTKDGWLRTGDLGRMDDEGYVFITGRLKELIIKGGENIAPREIDDALYAHPDVVEAAAFACTCPQYGQRVEAAVMLCEGSALTTEQLLDLCRDRVGAFKSPDKIHVLPELPKGPSGKIQRMKLVEMTA